MKLRKSIAWLLLLFLVLTLAPGATFADPPVGPCDGRDAGRNEGNHFWNVTGRKDPTCLEAGYVDYRCIYCQRTYRDTIPALGHDWGKPHVVKEPTCTEDGYQRVVCKRDSSHVRNQTIPALGHDWSEWYVVKEPTLTEEGLEERKCQRCGLTEQRPIPMLGVKEEYSLALVMNQSGPAGNVFAYDDLYGESSGIFLLYNVTLINTGLGPMNIRDFVGGAGDASTIDTEVLYPGESASFKLPWTLVPEDIIPGSGSETMAGAAHYSFCFFGDDFDGYRVCCSNTVSFDYKIMNPEGFEDWKIPSECTVWKVLLNGPSDPNGWQLGETLTYVIYVQNTGEQDIEGLTIYDVMDGYPEEALLTVDLAVDETKASLFQHEVTPEDVNKGYISNFGRARWADPTDGELLERHSDDITVTVINKAGLLVTKAVEGGPANGKYYVPGETVHFKVTVHNNTGITQKSIVVVDPPTGETKTCPDIEPGKSVTLDFDYTVTEYDAILGYMENYAYTMEIDGFSNTVRVDTGFDDPFGVITALEVTKVETSTFINGHGYELGDLITYEITVKNVGETVIVEGTVHDSLMPGSGEIGAFDNLYPDSSRTYTCSHEVNAWDILYGKVVNQAFVWMDGYLVSSNILESPTWGEVPPPDDTPLGGDDCCIRTLTGKGPGADAYTVHFCGEHLKLLEDLEEAQAAAPSEAEYLTLAQAAWQEAMDGMYETAAGRVGSELAAALMAQRLTFLTYLDTYKALLTDLYPDQPDLVARELLRETQNRCIDLCYELHQAPETRPDSVLGEHAVLPEAAAGEACARTEGQREGSELPCSEVLCASHAAIAAKAAALYESAVNAEARANAFLRIQRLWQTPLDARTNAHYKAADKEGKALIAKNRLAFDKYLSARKALLTALYPDRPDVVAEVVARVILDKEMDLCMLWK